MSRDVIFERRVDDHWEPVQYSNLQVGDTVQMRDTHDNTICEEGRVQCLRGTDPDTAQRADLFIEPAGR